VRIDIFLPSIQFTGGELRKIVPMRPDDELQAGGHFQLLKNVVHVVLYRAWTDVESLGNLWVAQSLGHETKHLSLAWRELT
jgi:hypothetical protein